ncbi:LLM class flavin-dependent oxidoreductase [Mycobacterium sp.]|uniref:LLM class flavin-dependent oxidoreductase n=1 Tax=Mycobacterium sp. TaxID=1785 RepID=UPI003C70C712
MKNMNKAGGRVGNPKLSFGYLYDFRNPEPWRRPWNDLYQETLDVVAWSETTGFRGAWVPEHHGADDGYMPTPNLALAAMAARTTTIRIGAAIAIAPLYHPVRFAEECAIPDILSNGRLETALAIGYRRREYEMHGERFGQRGSRFDEFLHIVRALWAGETVNFAGKHYTVKDARIMPAPPRGTIPLYIGGFTEKAMERVANYADGYFGNEEICDLYIEKLRQHGKDPSRAAIRIPGLFLTVAEDPEKAMEELAPYYHHVYTSYGAWMNEDNAIGLDNPATQPMGVGAFKRSGIVQILTPEQAVSYFKAMQERMPLEHFMMMRPPGLPAERFIEYAQLFADKVIPAFT